MSVFKQVEVLISKSGFRVELDGRPLQTPNKRVLEMPHPKLADAISLEWKNQHKGVASHNTPLTRLANSAVDRVRKKRGKTIQELIGYASTDLLCYRVEKPSDLKVLQDKLWQAALDDFATKTAVKLKVTYDVSPVEQNPECLSNLNSIISGLDDFQLTGLLSLTCLSGSIVLGVSMFYGWMEAQEACSLIFLDEVHQESIWGEDSESLSRRKKIKDDICDSHYFASLVVSDLI